MKVLLIARKSLVELLREPLLLGMILFLPLFMELVTAVGYGSIPLVYSYEVWVYPPQAEGPGALAALREARYADGRPVFTLTGVEDLAAAKERLKQSPAAVLLDFSTQPWTLYGDATNTRYVRASLALETALSGTQQAGAGQSVQFVEERMPPFGASSQFEAYTPGMMIFALLMVIPQTALVLGRELRWGTLKRLVLTRVRAWELLLGVSLAQLAIAAVQVMILFTTAFAFGFKFRGSLLLSGVVCLGVAFSAIGVGCLVAGISKKDSDAINTGSVFTMLQVFLSGAFFPMPSPELFKLGTQPVYLFDFIPATHGMLALQQVLSDGAGLSQVAFHIAACLLLSLLYFGLGVWLFDRFHFHIA